MNERARTLAVRAALGALGGTAGVLMRASGIRASRRLPLRLQPTQPRRDPDAFLVSKLERTLHRPLPRGVHDALARCLSVGYGAMNGALLALLTRRRGIKTFEAALLTGAAIGTLVWAIGYAGWMPRARLVPRVRGQGMTHIMMSVLAFAASGVVTALPVLALDRATRRQPRWRRALSRLAADES